MKQTKINRNEMFYPPAPKVKKALLNFDIKKASKYIEGYYHSPLTEKIAKKFSYPSDRVLIFYGLENFFRNIFDQLDKTKHSVLTNQYHFAYFSSYLKHLGVKLHQFKLIDAGGQFDFDIADFAKKYKQYKPKIVLLTSPNNPTGNILKLTDLQKILKVASANTLVILDEAYFGFDKNYKAKKYINLTNRYPNLLLARTFSKFYGLAGLRIGYGLAGKKAKEIINYQPYYLNFSQILEAAAIAALDSDAYYQKIAAQISQDRDWFINEVNKLNHFYAYQSATNFTLVKVNKKILPKLKSTIARQPANIALFFAQDLMRVSITLPKYTKRFLRILKSLD